MASTPTAIINARFEGGSMKSDTIPRGGFTPGVLFVADAILSNLFSFALAYEWKFERQWKAVKLVVNRVAAFVTFCGSDLSPRS